MPIEAEDKMLRGIEPMIWSILNKYKNIPYETMKDLKQDVMVYLLNNVMPKFDPKLAKFSSFAYRCIVNFINRRLYRDKRRHDRDLSAAERYYDTVKERYSAGMATFEGEYAEILYNITSGVDIGLMKGKELKAIKIIMDNPYVTQKSLAKRLKYRHSSAVSMMLLRMRKRLKNGKYKQI
jgi:RNA polymerase sigma factor (sigma-70 family)